MSGHSKWATIKHKKGALDAKRGKIFSRLSKEITIAAKSGGNPDMNPTLRTLVAKAKAANMPKDNVDKAIKKGTGELEGAQYEEVSFEGYAGGGVGVIVQAVTDNRNRATAEIRHIFTKNNSNFATQGAVSRNFARKGQIIIDASLVEEDKLMEIALNAGADDLEKDGDQYVITTEPAAYNAVAEAIQKANIATISSEVAMIPLVSAPVADKGVASAVLKFVEALEEQDDVQNVYHNMDCPDEVMAEIAKEGDK